MATTKPRNQFKVDSDAKPTMKPIRRVEIDEKTRNNATFTRNRKFVKG